MTYVQKEGTGAEHLAVWEREGASTEESLFQQQVGQFQSAWTDLHHVRGMSDKLQRLVEMCCAV